MLMKTTRRVWRLLVLPVYAVGIVLVALSVLVTRGPRITAAYLQGCLNVFRSLI